MSGNSFRRKTATDAAAQQLSRVLEVGQALTREERPASIPIGALHPDPQQPRRHFDPQALEDLARSMREHGVLQPLLVRPSAERGQYEIVCGERRYRAAQQAGLHELPVFVRDLSDAEASAAALVENLEREPLDPLEAVDGTLRAISLSTGIPVGDVPDWLRVLRNHPDEHPEDVHAVEGLLARVRGGKLASFVVNRLPLLNLPPVIADAVRGGRLDYTKARKIAAAPHAHHEELTHACLEHGWSTQQLSARIQALTPERTPEGVDRLRKALSARRLAALPGKDRQRADKLVRELLGILEAEGRSE